MRKNDWVIGSGQQIGRIRKVYEDRGETLIDVVIYDLNGNRLGRTSPAMGGPTTFEPACSVDGWRVLSIPPVFPLRIWDLDNLR